MTTRGLLLAGLAVLFVAPALVADVKLVRRGDGSILISNDGVGSGWRVGGQAPSDLYLLSRKDAVTPYDGAIQETARRHGVDAQLVRSVILVESNFNPAAVSRKGARGLMQLMPGTAQRYGVKNVHDAVENIRGGVAYLSDLLTAYRGDLTLALAAYNAGEGAVQRHAGVPPYPETQEYVRRAMLVLGGTRPLLGGGFKGMPVGKATASGARSVRSDPVRLEREGGETLISTLSPLRRSAPLLGRVETGAETGETRQAR